jgi:hypothetical protein
MIRACLETTKEAKVIDRCSLTANPHVLQLIARPGPAASRNQCGPSHPHRVSPMHWENEKVKSENARKRRASKKLSVQQEWWLTAMSQYPRAMLSSPTIALPAPPKWFNNSPTLSFTFSSRKRPIFCVA